MIDSHEIKTVLVTGGCGFIGANLIPLLESSGYAIRVLDNLSKGDAQSLATTLSDVRVGDIRSRTDVTDALLDMDAVIHLAAYGSVVESVANPDENFDINVHGTYNLLSACRDAKVKRIVFASTGGALIGNAKPPVNENSVPRPISPYGASKLAGEGYCCAFSSAYGIPATALRFANVIGPFSWHKKGAVTAFFKAILDDRPLVIYGDGSASRDFLFAEDLCIGIEATLHTNLHGFQTFHLASGREITIMELADSVRRVVNRPDHPIHFQAKRPGEVERNFATYELARSALGFKPHFTLDEALRETWNWVQSHIA